ncbi:MAG: metalloregulator ArsR/SmtB family transcription factor [Alphaproteobacteria bacterium]|jgi:ubiquinone/menaquinone biosynthesis C-methylase UbiE/DNA-binding transcriptional ArsR family regulator|nr:metalloregulator ArsR/SmtB family transcription factor [Alphaproteobacteria bacterium]MBT4711123.1 metalloregulator ArsR/SmtB family transcription factor [Alphaproteobacteria bacterium]
MESEVLLTGLRAAGEPTRLRLLSLCARGEFTVSDFTQILGQSQPRVSRHLKLLCDAGLVDRFREGTWAFYRLAEHADGGTLSRTLADLISDDDPDVARDLERLADVKAARLEAADKYFRANASQWDEIRSLYVPEKQVEAALMDVFDPMEIADYLDIGTGTGRMLELFGGRVTKGIGIDMSREMLSVARAKLDAAGLDNCQVRLGDMYALPIPSHSIDAVTVHQVLRYADDPQSAIREAARVLRPGGRVAVVDFAPHDIETLRGQHAHRRLGFSHDEVAGWLQSAGLNPGEAIDLEGDPLTVTIWPADAPQPEAQD